MAASDQPVCQRHGRPAVASRVRRRPDGTQEVEYLCEIDLAEEQMSSRFGGGSSLFDDFFSDFFADRGSAGGGARRTAAPQQVERVDVTQFFSDATRELLQRAAQTAVEWGSLDLYSDHLLYAALQDDVVRHVLREIDADPGAIAAEIEEEADKAQRTDVSPSLSPDAKAALLAAYDESRELESSYVGPGTSCSRSHATTRARQASSCSASGSRTRSFAAPSSAARVGRRPTRSHEDADARPVRPRPDRDGSRGEARPGDRPGR